MKKTLLLSSLIVFGMTLNAQQRMVLYEEFTGENCPPCASTNPPLDALMESNSNDTKIIKIQYQSPIPTAGPLYYQNTTDVQNRMQYYGVNFAPWGQMDGALPPGVPPSQQSANHPAYLTQLGQNSIDQAAAVATPFTIDIVNYSISGGNVTADIKVTSSQSVNAGTLKLRAALLESLFFSTAPGTNGEVDFPLVVRKMYPDANGQTIPSTWSSNENHTYSISGAIPSYVDLSNEHFLVFWIQDDNSKEVMQTARTFSDLDVASLELSTDREGTLNCGLPLSVVPTVTIKNKGTQALTSAVIYYKAANAATWEQQNWTGNLALGQTDQVTLSAIDVTEAGRALIIDSVAKPNNTTDPFSTNNMSAASVTVIANVNGQALPISSDFEVGNNEGWTPYANAGGYPLSVAQAAGGGFGYNGSDRFLYYPCYSLQSGSGLNILPFASLPSGAKALDFYVAYAQYSNNGTPSGNDRLEVVYSTNCGQSWTSVWNKAGADLASAPASSSAFRPSGSSSYKLVSVDMSNVPDGAQIALRATSDYGNDMFIDNVNLRVGQPTGIDEVLNTHKINLYPNPVNDRLMVELEMKANISGTFQISNALGQMIHTTQENLTQGMNRIELNTQDLAAGIYFLSIQTDEGTVLRKFVKK